jgi:outer membrane protein assembly factor BamA
MRESVVIYAISVVLASMEPVGAVEISGNRLYSDKELIRLVDLTLPDDSLSRTIMSVYRRAGYYSARVKDIGVDKRGQKLIFIEEGEPSIVDSISIDVVPDSLKIHFSDLVYNVKGQVASRDLLDDFAETAVLRLAECGMPFASGEWSDFKLNQENNITATFKIISGPRCYISGFVFNGITRTKPETIKKAIYIRVGDLYSESEVQDSEKSIDRMPYIELTSPFGLEAASAGDSCRIIYSIKELPSTRFDGAGGFINTKGRSDFLGRLGLEFGDILGTGRSFGLLWNKKDRFSSELRLDYLEPFFMGSRFDVKLEVFQLDRDSLYIETGGRIGLEYRFGRGSSGGLRFSAKRTEPEGSADIPSSISRSVKLDFAYDQTDYIHNPRDGYMLKTEVDYRYRSNRRVVEGDDPPTQLSAVGFDGSYFAGIGGRFVIAIRLAGWGIASADGTVPVDELRFIGGFDDLRGYVEEQFPAYRYAVATIEPRILTGRRSRAYAFGDFGVIKGTQSQKEDYRFWPGYGFGLASPTGIGLFKIEIGWGKTGFPSEAIFNFGLAGAF